MENKEKTNKTELVAVIRIAGQVKVRQDLKNSLKRFNLLKKYTCTLIDVNNKSQAGILKKVMYKVAYGKIKKETLIKLIEKRGQKINKEKIDSKKTAQELLNGKTLKQSGLKSFFRLHPPRKGINSKLQYPRGVLGDNKEDINKLIERML